ncbi:MAG TPA: helix-turn-helix domain-containing protein [Acidimicrobiales bacterium]|nr:helix-turn-helix domain-containing protein [Acidimicrobiales bacterium]
MTKGQRPNGLSAAPRRASSAAVVAGTSVLEAKALIPSYVVVRREATLAVSQRAEVSIARPASTVVERAPILGSPVAGLLDVRAAAEYLSVSVRTVKNLLSEGKLPYVKIGRATRLTAVDLDSYISQNRRRNRRAG